MFSVIMGKSKGIADVGSLIDPCIIVGGSFTGNLKAYQKSDLTEVTGINKAVWTGTTVKGIVSDTDNIYFCGANGTSNSDSAIVKIEKTTKIGTQKLKVFQNSETPHDALFIDGSTIHVVDARNTNGAPKYRNTNGGSGSTTATSRASAITVMGDYAYIGGAGTTMGKYLKTITSGTAPTATYTQTGVTGLCNDGTYIYASLSSSPYLKVFDANFNVISGYPTISTACYCSMVDTVNDLIILGATSGTLYFINRTTKALTTNTLASGTINTVTQDSDYIYYGGTAGIIYRLPKSNIYATPTQLISGLAAITSIHLT